MTFKFLQSIKIEPLLILILILLEFNHLFHTFYLVIHPNSKNRFFFVILIASSRFIARLPKVQFALEALLY